MTEPYDDPFPELWTGHYIQAVCCEMSRNDFLVDHAEAMRRSLRRWLAREYAQQHRKLIPWRARRA